MQEEDEKTDSNEDYDSFLKEAGIESSKLDFKQRTSTNIKPSQLIIAKKDQNEINFK